MNSDNSDVQFLVRNSSSIQEQTCLVCDGSCVRYQPCVGWSIVSTTNATQKTVQA